MKKAPLYLLSFLFSTTLHAQDARHINLNEVVVTSPKAVERLFEVPASVTLITGNEVEQQRITSLKEAAELVPNLYIPDYGSRLTSSIYIRGIGSRINSPAVGLNIDNVPYIDKSLFDIELANIERIEVLRGPQSTLYGRNTMGGLINIYTRSPLQTQGTRLRVGVANYGNASFAASHNAKIGDKVGIQVGAHYRREGGYFTNSYNDKQADALELGGANIRIDARINRRFKLSFVTLGELSDQGAFPYMPYNKTSGELSPISYNDISGYSRKLSNSSLQLQYLLDEITLTSTTGFQAFSDVMKLDQDFTPASIFTLEQHQRQQNISQEFVARSTGSSNLSWTAGVFGFYQALHTIAPVTFKQEGIQKLVVDMTNRQLAALKQENPRMPEMTLSVNNRELLIKGDYNTPSYGAAIFSQVGYNDLFFKGLSATVGLRLDYEKASIVHRTYSNENLTGSIHITPPRPGLVIPPVSINVPLSLEGDDAMESLQLLPKFELTYAFSPRAMMYGSIARGYRSGGYNIQSFSNIIQKQIEQGIMAAGGVSRPIADDQRDVYRYLPEFSWNYEVGGRIHTADHRLTAEAALFYIDCLNQQVSVVSGYGRSTKNSGRSSSFGGELSVGYIPIKNLHFSAAYGYTHATFTEYNDDKVDFRGNRVPFAPAHSLSVSGRYTLPIQSKYLDAIVFSLQNSVLGDIYWDEANTAKQPLYALLNGDVTFVHRGIEIALWGRNLTNTQYNAFYFETMNADRPGTTNGFAQQGRPLTFGAEVRIRF